MLPRFWCFTIVVEGRTTSGPQTPAHKPYQTDVSSESWPAKVLNTSVALRGSLSSLRRLPTAGFHSKTPKGFEKECVGPLLYFRTISLLHGIVPLQTRALAWMFSFTDMASESGPGGGGGISTHLHPVTLWILATLCRADQETKHAFLPCAQRHLEGSSLPSFPLATSFLPRPSACFHAVTWTFARLPPIRRARSAWNGFPCCDDVVLWRRLCAFSPVSGPGEKGGKIPLQEFLLVEAERRRARAASRVRTVRSTRVRSHGCPCRGIPCESAPCLPRALFAPPRRPSVRRASAGEKDPLSAAAPPGPLVYGFPPRSPTGRFVVSVPFEPGGRSGSSFLFVRGVDGNRPVVRVVPWPESAVTKMRGRVAEDPALVAHGWLEWWEANS